MFTLCPVVPYLGEMRPRLSLLSLRQDKCTMRLSLQPETQNQAATGPHLRHLVRLVLVLALCCPHC